MDITTELTRLFGLKSANEVSQGGEIFGQGGYLSFRRAVTITKDGSQPLHVFIKCSDVSRSELDKLQEISNYFCRTECVFYGLMAPVLERVIGQYEIEPVFPRAFGQRISDKGTILVMEDMTKLGFDLVNRQSFGIEQAYCVVNTLARLQAAYWIARTSFNYSLDSVLFGFECPFSDTVGKSGVDMKPLMEHSVTYFFENFAKHTKSAEDEAAIRSCVTSFVSVLLADPAKAMPSFADKPTGLAHGDLWFSNFMFKGDGEAMICRLFDWQFWNVALFGFDLGLLMVSSLSTEVLQEHVDKIPTIFYKTFKDIYEAKTGNPAPFTEEAALENMPHSFFFAMFWVITTSHPLWESGHMDVPNMLANLAFAIRSGRIAIPLLEG